MLSVRRARVSDAPMIGAVHVAAWRSAYPGILPDAYLAGLSVARHAAHYDMAIRIGQSVFVAVASGTDAPEGARALVVGFATAGRSRTPSLAEGEIETLYMLDDWRDRGLGRRLMRAAAASLAGAGCRSAFLWVLRDNPSRFFYQRLGGREAARSTVHVAGRPIPQTAYVWDPIEKLLAASPAK